MWWYFCGLLAGSFAAKVTKIIHIQFNANRNKQMNWNNISHSLALQ
jgi:cytochrome c oxidase assembly protein Cox11